MAAKRWSYAEITKAAEAMIRFNLEKAAEAEAGNDTSAYLVHRNFAHGAYLLWHRLTLGFQKEGDDERLERLLDRALKGGTNDTND